MNWERYWHSGKEKRHFRKVQMTQAFFTRPCGSEARVKSVKLEITHTHTLTMATPQSSWFKGPLRTSGKKGSMSQKSVCSPQSLHLKCTVVLTIDPAKAAERRLVLGIWIVLSLTKEDTKKPVAAMSRNWWIRWFDIKRFPRISSPSCNSLKIYILHWAEDLRSCAAPGFFFEDHPPPAVRGDRHGVAACRVPCRSCSSSGGWEPLLGGAQAAGEPYPGLGGTIYCKLHI